MHGVIGIAGTAKNTGKTTALNALLTIAHSRRVPAAVTSIGYDGESIDNVTGLSKPRIVLHPGAIATTARSCVPSSGWDILANTGCTTALGELVVVRCREAGVIVLAGPNRRSELARVVRLMQSSGPAFVLVDGALNRLAPMAVADAFILSTGAARTQALATLAQEAAATEACFALPVRSGGGALPEVPISTAFPSVNDLIALTESAGHPAMALAASFPLEAKAVAAVAGDPRLGGRIRSLILSDPILPLLSGDTVAMVAALERCRAAGVELSVRKGVRLAAVTVNPFFPRFEGHSYAADGVDPHHLRTAVSEAVGCPVLNVVAEGPEPLWEAVERGFNRLGRNAGNPPMSATC